MARVIQAAPSDNAGEQRMLRVLTALPDDWTVLCEFRLDASRDASLRGLAERRPDFLLLAPEVGVVSIETKHWDIVRNTYVWVDQRTVRRDPDGVIVVNPWHQAFVYEKVLQRLLGGKVWVTSLVAFPLLDRAMFWNRLQSPKTLDNPQAHPLIALDRTLFRDDLDRRPAATRQVLLRAVQRDPRFRAPAPSTITEALERLLPAEFRVGDSSERCARERKQLRILSERQQHWASRLPEGSHCLMDLAGSGKTNVLVSRAIHLAKHAPAGCGVYRVLILTYGPKLARALTTMLDDKFGDEPRPANATIDVRTIEDLLREIVARLYGVASSAVEARSAGTASLEQRIQRLLQDIGDLDAESETSFRCFDAILIDEVQDYSRLTGWLVKLLHRGAELFVVGDLAQRLYGQPMELFRLGIDGDRASVPAEYVMYRCPRAVANMAHGFALEDAALRRELEGHGYGTAAAFRGPSTTLPEVRHAATATEERQILLDLVREQAADGLALRDVLVITSPEAVGQTLGVLQGAEVPVRLDPDQRDGVLVVSYVDSKGLEAQAVIVMGMEQLVPNRPDLGLFDDPARVRDGEGLARRQAYVAMTRTTGRLYCLYRHASHPLVAAMLRHVRRVTEEVAW